MLGPTGLNRYLKHLFYQGMDQPCITDSLGFSYPKVTPLLSKMGHLSVLSEAGIIILRTWFH
jgi:hypothetical protein